MATITISKTTARRFVLGRQGPNALARGLVGFAEFLDVRQVNISVLEPAALREQVREYIGEVFEIQRL